MHWLIVGSPDSCKGGLSQYLVLKNRLALIGKQFARIDGLHLSSDDQLSSS